MQLCYLKIRIFSIVDESYVDVIALISSDFKANMSVIDVDIIDEKLMFLDAAV